MRRPFLLLFLLVASGCTIPTEPQPVPFDNRGLRGYYDYNLARPINFPYADGIFSSRAEHQDNGYRDSAGNIQDRSWYESHASLYNALGDEIDEKSFSVTVDNKVVPFRQYYGYDTDLDLNFPAPVD